MNFDEFCHLLLDLDKKRKDPLNVDTPETIKAMVSLPVPSLPFHFPPLLSLSLPPFPSPLPLSLPFSIASSLYFFPHPLLPYFSSSLSLLLSLSLPSLFSNLTMIFLDYPYTPNTPVD